MLPTWTVAHGPGVLPDWTSSGALVHTVYLGTRQHSPKVMAFVDLLRERWPASLAD